LRSRFTITIAPHTWCNAHHFAFSSFNKLIYTTAIHGKTSTRFFASASRMFRNVKDMKRDAWPLPPEDIPGSRGHALCYPITTPICR